MENITVKARQASLRWYGHIMWMNGGQKGKQTMKLKVRGTWAKGRQRMRLMDSIWHDMNECGLEEGDAQDRRRWRRIVQSPDLAS